MLHLPRPNRLEQRLSKASLIPAIFDHIVKDEIIPRLPWHTRPLLIALNRDWWNALEGIGVDIVKKTRLKQPMKCRLLVEYYHTFRDRSSLIHGYVLKIFDGQWRNVAPITGHGPYTYKSYEEGHGKNRKILHILDGTMYFVEHEPADGLNGTITITIITLDVGSGSWEWKKVYERKNHSGTLVYICRSGRVPGGHFLYWVCRNQSYSEITEISAWKEITKTEPCKHILRLNTVFSFTKFVHVGSRLYFDFEDYEPESVSFFDLNTRERSHYIPESGSDLIVQKDVLLVAFNGKHFHILRYDLLKERWIRAGRMLAPDDSLSVTRWTWCVEYDQQGEKQLWIYISPQTDGEEFNVYKLQVVQRERLTPKVWDDIELLNGEVECELLNRTSIGQGFQPVEHFHDDGNAPVRLFLHSFRGFHRSDTTNFEDIPHVNVPNIQ